MEHPTVSLPPDQTLTHEALERDLISVARATSGYPEAHLREIIAPLVQYLLREYGGERLPKITRARPEDEIVRAVQNGMPKREACRYFGVPPATLYRMLGRSKAA